MTKKNITPCGYTQETIPTCKNYVRCDFPHSCKFRGLREATWVCEYEEAQVILKAVSAQLEALGFSAMSQDVLKETDWSRVREYVRLIIKQTPEPLRDRVIRAYRKLRLA